MKYLIGRATLSFNKQGVCINCEYKPIDEKFNKVGIVSSLGNLRCRETAMSLKMFKVSAETIINMWLLNEIGADSEVTSEFKDVTTYNNSDSVSTLELIFHYIKNE